MNRQELFEKAARGLLAQDGRSTRSNEKGEVLGCAYRGPNGRKCAIGHLIPDELYSSGMECRSAYGVLGMNGNVLITARDQLRAHLGIETEDDVRFLSDLQQVHDSCWFWDNIKDHLALFAQKNRLKMPG